LATPRDSNIPIKITFENLEYEVNALATSSEAKLTGKSVVRQKIVKGVSGYANPGHTLYIMGASGAGKTSLLNMLSDRISQKGGATLGGTIKVNDTVKLDQKVFGMYGAYVM
jgi:ATP-binding cassette, subfamily G (WHITE), eye pigment precursor transporter